MTAAPHQLAAPYGPVMLALASANAAALADDLDLAKLLRTLWDPWKVPASELTLLASAWNLDFYEDHWPEARKRQTIAEARLYHSRKTSVAGVRMALGYKDATLVRAHLPRHGFFVDRRPSAAEEAAWRERLPELRVYDVGPIVLAPQRLGRAGRSRIIRGDARLLRTATLFKDGVEAPVQVVPSRDPARPGERFVLPIGRVSCLIVGRAGNRFLAPSTLPVKTIAIRYGEGDTFLRGNATLGDQGTFVQTRRRPAQGAQAPMTPIGRGGKRIIAPVKITRGFLSLKYSDEAGRLASRAPSNVVGRSRIQRAPFTASFLVDWKRTRPRSFIPPGRRILPSAAPLVAGLREAIVAAQAARDVTSISLSSTRRLTFADIRAIKAGTRFGDRKVN